MPDSLQRYKADIFQALAHPTRIAILEILNVGEFPAGALNERLGLEQATVSQHLAVLRAKRLVVTRKVGNQVFYALRDPILVEILSLMRSLYHTHLKEATEMLEEMENAG